MHPDEGSKLPRRTPLRGPLRQPILLAGGALVLVAGLLYGSWHGGGAPVDFNEEVRPILNARCVTCHGGIKRSGGLNLLFRADALAPTESGRHAIVPGDPGGSELLRRITHPDPDERMPPEGAPLSDEEVDVLRRWIAQGAPWADHWAYVAPRAVPLPEVSVPAWPRNGIDHFVLARLDAEGLVPAERARCAVLLRRVALDLVGLPPAPADVEAFCADPSQEAYARAVDRLLASPRFGERWAALWLDLARYADSRGYEKDDPRTIWRYRDWVIRAFNEDMPFDRFTVEQLAGDLLPGAGTSALVATALHRNTMTNDEGGTDDEEFRIAAVIDRVNTTWEVWQGTTIACVQCHGHPYDPFRHEEYYRLFAFFNNTADDDGWDEEPLLYEFDEEDAAEGARLQLELSRLEAELAEAARDSAARHAWTARLEAHARLDSPPPTFDGRLLPHELLRVARRPDSLRSAHDRALLARTFAEYHPATEALRERRGELRGRLRELASVTTPILRELPEGERRTTRLFVRGNWLVHGDPVEAGVPAAMPPLPPDASRDRLGLARWLVSQENPLTARVLVNRFWEQLFGVGLVETVEDFGTQGTPPSHPELLDWLALQFVHEHGWSVKALLRQIVLSNSYQQASVVTPELRERDPANRLLARGPRFRLTAEQIRDQALAVSGLLSEKMYGPSVMPPQPEGLWQAPYSALEWTTSEGEDRYRRAVYTFLRRTVPYPSMLTFDGPSREVCLSRRIRTNTPLQALVTLNDPVSVEAAAALAGRMAAAGAPLDEQLRAGYRRALLEDPSEATLGTLRALYDEAYRHYRDHHEDAEALLRIRPVRLASPPDEAHRAALTLVANAVLNLDAFLTKE